MMHEKPSGTLIPSVGTLHHPALGQHHEAFGICRCRKQVVLSCIDPTADITIGWVAHHAHLDTVALRERLRTLTGVGVIHKEGLNAGMFRQSRGHQRMGAIPVLNAGCGHTDSQQQAQGIDGQMTFTPLHLLAGIVAAAATLGRAACGLCVQYCNRRSASRFSRSRQRARSRSCICSNLPGALQRRKVR